MDVNGGSEREAGGKCGLRKGRGEKDRDKETEPDEGGRQKQIGNPGKGILKY